MQDRPSNLLGATHRFRNLLAWLNLPENRDGPIVVGDENHLARKLQNFLTVILLIVGKHAGQFCARLDHYISFTGIVDGPGDIFSIG